MALFSLTVDSGSVASSLSDYPAYVDLSQMPAGFWSVVSNGGGDIRCYSDQSKTTELAREVVSCDTATDTGELHVKIPSLTTTTVIYIDVDGVRSDYAVTDTYGRNAVWSDYAGVWHLNEASGTRVDSTGNNDLTDNNTVTSEAGQIGDAALFNGSSEFLSIADAAQTGLDFSEELTFSAWINPDVINSGERIIFSKYRNDTNQRQYIFEVFDSGLRSVVTTAGNNAAGTTKDVRASSVLTANVKQYVTLTAVCDTEVLTHYVNGSAVTNTFSSGSLGTSFYNGSEDFRIGAQVISGNFNGLYDGGIDEARAKEGALSADWITTEYNNQSDVAGFWTIAEVSTTTLGLKLGSTTINRVMFGSTEIKKIYLGSTVIYENL